MYICRAQPHGDGSSDLPSIFSIRGRRSWSLQTLPSGSISPLYISSSLECQPMCRLSCCGGRSRRRICREERRCRLQRSSHEYGICREQWDGPVLYLYRQSSRGNGPSWCRFTLAFISSGFPFHAHLPSNAIKPVTVSIKGAGGAVGAERTSAQTHHPERTHHHPQPGPAHHGAEHELVRH